MRDWRVPRLFATIAHMATQTHTRRKTPRYAIWQRPDGKWMARWIDGPRAMESADPFVSREVAERWAKATKARRVEWAQRAAR